jgi:hypothetical protein
MELARKNLNLQQANQRMKVFFQNPSLFRPLPYRPLTLGGMAAGLFLMLLPGAARAQDKPAGPAADVVVLKNGDQLTGKLERAVGDSMLFKSDVVGEVTIPMDKVKELHSNSNFVVLKKDEKVTRAPKQAEALTVEDGGVKETAPNGTAQTIASKEIGYIIDGATYNKELNGHPGFLQGWDGSITGGATVLQSSSYGQTLTAGLSLIRAIPSVAYLPPRTRTTFNLLETYGKLTQPVIPNPNHLPDSMAKTNIFHTDFEHDKYLTPRFYMLGNLMYDHNFSQGLDFQQIYGVGAGYTILTDAVQQLDAKADVHYERQTFIQTPPIITPDQDLVGSTFGESYKRTLPGKILLTQGATYIQSWNNTDAWSALGSFGLALPVYHRFSLSLNLLDNYLNNPAFGYKKNSLQFVTGVTYTLH